VSSSEPQGHATPAPRCWIYRSRRKDELYLYLREPDRFDLVPEPLRRLFGEPVLVMELNLDGDRRLARVDAAQVRQALAAVGFFLQMPPVREAQQAH
jgi:uncharacterized protein YcgL (UPF0745 family)